MGFFHKNKKYFQAKISKQTQPNLKVFLKTVKIHLRSLKNVLVDSFHSFQTNWKTLVLKIDLETSKFTLKR